eukprot:1494563-Pleurochrysis_carterae.AAC.1
MVFVGHVSYSNLICGVNGVRGDLHLHALVVHRDGPYELVAVGCLGEDPEEAEALDNCYEACLRALRRGSRANTQQSTHSMQRTGEKAERCSDTSSVSPAVSMNSGSSALAAAWNGECEYSRGKPHESLPPALSTGCR